MSTASAPFHTRQFRAGNSQTVRIPTEMAFPLRTELVVFREGNRITVEPKKRHLGELPGLFHALDAHFEGERPDFEEIERDWS